MQASLSLPNSKASQGHVQFEGTLEHGKDGVDCVLVFEGGACRLEALAGHINNLRSPRSAHRASARYQYVCGCDLGTKTCVCPDARARADIHPTVIFV